MCFPMFPLTQTLCSESAWFTQNIQVHQSLSPLPLAPDIVTSGLDSELPSDQRTHDELSFRQYEQFFRLQSPVCMSSQQQPGHEGRNGKLLA